jgi:proton-coupled amino acid transporter
MAHKAHQEGKQPPNIVTRNFIDFLVLYGYFGGDVYPSDDEDEDVVPISGAISGSGGQDPEQGLASERSPLLPRTKSATSVQGTSAKKAFFMLLKAFVGTGVLFLPQAFKNGGAGFSLILMVVLGYLTLHCMALLVETSRSMGGLSFGDLGERLFSKKMKQLVLGSIAISQVCTKFF